MVIRLTLRALTDSGSATLHLTVGDLGTDVAVTVGLAEEPFADLADAAAWTSAHDRAPGGSVTPAEGHGGAPGLRLAYDFTQSTGTRGQYAVPPAPIPLPGQPQALTVWIHGDGNGAWPRVQYRDAAGVTANLDGPTITWTGWRQVTFPVPAGVRHPLTFQRFRLLETSAARSYRGQVTISDLRARVAPEVELPAAPRTTDPVIQAHGTVDDRPLRIAVMSDAQFVARDPNSPQVAAARRTLEEIAAAAPDLLVINGDLVDEASPADLDLARRLLTEFEARTGGTVPWRYVPGNHEIMGPGSTANFRAEFGDTFGTLDLAGTRLITLDSSTGTLRGGGFDQLQLLRDTLDDAAADPAVSGVVLFAHHPARDPLPDAASQLADRKEAAMVERWLADFRAEAGKSAAYVAGHVGVFAAWSVDGVPHLVNGNSGKNPAGTPDQGGFTGWTMLGIDPAHGTVTDRFATPADDASAWLRAETHPRVDALTLQAPDTLALLARTPVTATLTQDGGRRVPVAWPVSARWSGDGVLVGDPARAVRDAAEQPGPRPQGAPVAVYDPATGTLTGLRPGQAVLRVTVGGVTAEHTVTVGGGTPHCDRVIDGRHDGPLTVTAGTTCLTDGARVHGPVTVTGPGATLFATGATLTGPLTARAADRIAVTDSTITGPVTVRGVHGQVALAWNRITGPVTLTDSGGAPGTGDGAPLLAGNTVHGPLGCTGNTSAPSDGGAPNTVHGPTTGECGAR
ncbi:metallophosphoesterase family protein [Allostreptomyces psammosilenae]|uniref:Calcineurin-like phosphoesterase domain-containing protein n=1 Tax=Allostreptomyces psammosilenae TaxID=1892865 RepID=A0A853A1E9_9ACTN|nr:metallophosphoesterase [Allostreptomyces psammosilenae]NYI06744.1 hypothetical protein [Allostreptomyces psammosilenae]